MQVIWLAFNQSRFVVHRRLGAGAHGDVFVGFDAYQKREVVIKLAVAPSPPAENEVRVYNMLSSADGIAELIWSGIEHGYHALVLEYLSPDLATVRDICNMTMEPALVACVGYYMLERLEFVHSRGFIHGDVKPSNFAGVSYVSRQQIIYLLDFGLADRYMHDGVHIEEGLEPISTRCTPSFASINVLRTFKHSRRDDLESLIYTFLYLLRSPEGLPWDELVVILPLFDDVWEGYAWLADIKASSTPHYLFQGFPEEFAHMLEYVRNLHFDETPDYQRLKDLCLSILEKADIQKLELKFEKWQGAELSVGVAGNKMGGIAH
ncbi:hypothetical protein EW146_g2369 [Bondarzewia mesenterica]|uniref:Protein kinase domain-containing protein n=1 Tax=Bondarzewia mesenterica TaxID=1095465 RepID=A0A4S4M351_9AGAM|nr:hypothetical protein EW146_g2369 [Bondarzewia mesenterica]